VVSQNYRRDASLAALAALPRVSILMLTIMMSNGAACVGHGTRNRRRPGRAFMDD
jgi:hypothetical protein